MDGIHKNPTLIIRYKKGKDHKAQIIYTDTELKSKREAIAMM